MEEFFALLLMFVGGCILLALAWFVRSVVKPCSCGLSSGSLRELTGRAGGC
jgi:hypothetical protein